MSSGITLTAGVRQNLLSLQNTADLISQTQNRLATGKKVNSALDNPTNYFTSQALNNRASDLNALLDSIGQAQQTLDAANQGLTSLTKLLQSAKSIAQQARQSSGPTAVTYGAISVNDTAQAETLGTATGTVAGPAATANGNLVLTVNGTNRTVALTSGDNAATIVSKINAVVDTGGGTNEIHASLDGSNHLVLTALNADVDFTISNTSTAQTLTDLGLTGGSAHNSTSLLDNIIAAGGANHTSTLSVAVNGGANQTITFGTGAGEVSTIAELNTALGGLSGVTASASGTSLSFSVASASTQNSLTLTGSTGISTALGVTNATSQGVASTPTPDATRTSLQSDYNNVLSQIDALAADSSYNGINLLNGDDLKVVFNEKGTSSLTITGVTFDTNGLGVSAVTGTAFQQNTNIDSAISQLNTALSTLRNQSSRFGATLTTVQTRQDFTKNLINTLQTGADSLVLADTNEEGANALALQTRQQLSTTALSLANQASQSVLRLFG